MSYNFGSLASLDQGCRHNTISAMGIAHAQPPAAGVEESTGFAPIT